MFMPSIFGDNLFDDDWMDFSFPRFDKMFESAPAVHGMKTDVKENEKDYEVAIELPGFDKNNIHAELKDGYLTVTASRDSNNDEKDDKGNYIRRERYTGKMSRSFYVGDDVTDEDIKARYADGILTLIVPKKEAPAVETGKTIAIEG